MKRLFVMCGAPGSGKSTFLSKRVFAPNAAPSIIVSRDIIRFALVDEDEEYFSKEKEVWETFISTIKDYLTHDNFSTIEDVYADATHLNNASRTKLLRALGDSLKDVEVNAVYFNLPVKVCLERNEKRQGTRSYVPPEVVCKMHASMTQPTMEEGFDKIYIVNENCNITLKVEE